MVNYDNVERLPLRHELEAERLQGAPVGVGPFVGLIALKVAGQGPHGEFKVSVQASLIDDLAVRDYSHKKAGQEGHAHTDTMNLRSAVRQILDVAALVAVELRVAVGQLWRLVVPGKGVDGKGLLDDVVLELEAAREELPDHKTVLIDAGQAFGVRFSCDVEFSVGHPRGTA